MGPINDSAAIKKVALAGATGNLGPAILKELIDAGFKVTVLTREGSDHSLPSGVHPVKVDYDSLDSLVAALKGQDAVVSTIASAALSKQLLLVDAAAAAGVKRFIPSEFGSNTVHPKTSQLPSYGDKVAVQDVLKKHAGQPNGMTYTFVINGPFFDWGLMVGFVTNPGKRQATLLDGGERLFSTTTLSTIGKAVAGVLLKPDETANRPVYVQDTAVSLKQLLAYGQSATGSPESWTVTEAKTEDLVQQGWAELGKDKPDPGQFVMKFISASIWGEGYGSKFDKLDNDLLGIPQMSEDEVKATVAKYAK